MHLNSQQLQRAGQAARPSTPRGELARPPADLDVAVIGIGNSGEAVALCFVGPGIPRDNVLRFDEVSAAAGALGQVRDKELMYLILNHTDRGKLMGIMDTPVDQAYYPGRYAPLRIDDA